jgi:peroxisomal 3,2-trans-enoyl-CoA isomerase
VFLQEEAKSSYIEYVNSLVGPENSEVPKAAEQTAAAGFEVSMNGKLRIITINKPTKKNAFSQEMYSDFAKVNTNLLLYLCLYVILNR